MAIYENTATRAGDFLVFTTRLPLVGVVRVTDFTDVTHGESTDTFFEKEISYSIDGLFFTPWLPLNPNTLGAISTPEGHLWVNYRYTRRGENTAVVLVFDNVELVGEFSQPVCQNEYALPKSAFREFFCHNPEHLSLCAHLTKKLFEEGIVPRYITRNQGESPATDDADYIALWSSVSCFFALFILFGQQFENISQHSVILREYLRQRGLLFSQSTDEVQLDYLRRNQYNAAALRGTLACLDTPKGNNTTYYSEAVSLLDTVLTRDEYAFGLLDKLFVSHTVNEDAGMFRTNRNNYYLNKAYERTADVIDLTKYPLVQPDCVSIQQVQLRNGETYGALAIRQVPLGTRAGIGGYDLDKVIVVDKFTDYEIAFYLMRKDENSVDLEFNLLALDDQNSQIALRTAASSPLYSNVFSTGLKVGNPGTPYLVRGILYGQRTEEILEKLSIDQRGTNLRATEELYKIIPQILIHSNNLNYDSAGEVYIWDIRITPLRPDYSLGFVESGPLAQMWAKNRNTNLTEQEVQSLIKRVLLPYDVRLDIKFLYDQYRTTYVSKFRASAVISHCSTPANNDGEIQLNPVGGNSPYLYDWATGQKLKHLTALVPGIYSVLITDSSLSPLKLNLVNLEVLPYQRRTAWRVKTDTVYCLTQPRNGN